MTTTHTPRPDERVIGWRHDLHERPETAFEEHLTSDYVADVLQGLGYEVTRSVGGTGVVASLTRGTSGRAIGLRTDMDCLPLDEDADHTPRSGHAGRMHACGHDGHMAMVLGAAAALTDDTSWQGTVRIVCQPAEEPGLGAQAMIDDGLFERFPMDAMFGLHNIPGLPAGHIHARPGGIMASEDDFEIVLTGRGGHASAPHLVLDPLVTAAEVITALQTVVARSIDPLRPAVLSCTEVHGDGARNAIPTRVTISGDTRSFDPADQHLLEQRIREIATGIASAHGIACEVTYTHEFSPTINDAEVTARAMQAAALALGAERVDANCAPIMASEDFAAFARAVPSCFALIGNGTEPGRGGNPLHSRGYAFNDDILAAGVSYYVAVAHAFLPVGD